MQFKSLKLIIGLLVVLSFSLPAWATVYLSLQPSSQEVALGSQFTVDMFLFNPTPEQLLSLNVWLTFDPYLLRSCGY